MNPHPSADELQTSFSHESVVWSRCDRVQLLRNQKQRPTIPRKPWVAIWSFWVITARKEVTQTFLSIFSKVFLCVRFACEPQRKVLIWAEIRTGWVRERSPRSESSVAAAQSWSWTATAGKRNCLWTLVQVNILLWAPSLCQCVNRVAWRSSPPPLFFF